MKRPWLQLLITSMLMTFIFSIAPAQFNWTNDPNNPRLTDGSLVLDPSVMYDATQGKYYLWYVDASNIKRAVSNDGSIWTSIGTSQSLSSLFSTSFCAGAEVIKIGSTYYMYAGCRAADGQTWYIGLATSSDGNIWTKHPSSPALTKGAVGTWDGAFVIGVRVTVKNGTYYMVYSGSKVSGQAYNEMGLATSPDGIHWEKSGANPVVGGSPLGQGSINYGPVGFEYNDGMFYLVESVNKNGAGPSYNLATSPDGISWSFYAGNPIVTMGNPGTWSAASIGGGALRYVAGKYQLWYCGEDYSGTWRMGLATSNVETQETFWHQTGGPLATQDVRILTSNSKGTLFAGTWTAGEVYKTTNNGDAWTVCGAIPNTNPVLGLTVDRHDHLFASVFLRGIARSTDNGATWQMKNNGLTSFTTRWSVMDKQGNVWVATEGGLFRTTDDGENWTKMHSAMCYNVWLDSTGAIMTQEGDGTGFDANGNSSNYVYRTTDGGTSWSTVHLIGKSFAGIHADGSYFANTYSLSSIFRSTDRGTTWTDLHCPVSWSGYTAMMSFLPNGDVFFTKNGDGAGVIRSTNNGASWEVKNDGLSTLRVTYLYPHPNGYLFLATGFAGVYRSTQVYIPPTQNISVSLPDVMTSEGSTVEIPVSVTSLSGHGILSYEININFNSPDSILFCNPLPITAGTLSAQPGWSVQLNNTDPNQVKIGAYGAVPLTGEGDLLRIRLNVLPGVQPGKNSVLSITHLLFNAGGMEPSVHNGSVTIHARVCGDADENGSVQAYDAALTLREALGPMSPPPAPLTAPGKLNADINMDGKVQAYDAALILRHVVGLPMPESTATCFGGSFSGTPSTLALIGKVNSALYSGGQWNVQLQLVGVPTNMEVLSYAFELTAPALWDDSTNLSLPQLPHGYLATVNRLGNGHFRVGIINPNGVDVAGIGLTLSAKYASSINTVTLTDVYLNDAPNASPIILANIFSNIEDPQTPNKPESYDLLGAYPNPFNPSTRIAFVIPSSSQVFLEVYNTLGMKIKTLLHEQLAAGVHEVSWNGTNDLGQVAASGQYYCLMRAGGFVKTVRLMLLK